MTPRFTQAFLTQWLVLGVAVAVLGLLLAYDMHGSARKVAANEGARLTVQARVIDINLAGQLDATAKLLDSLRNDALVPGAITSARLKSLDDLIPGVRTLLIADAAGRVRHANRDALIGFDASSRDYYLKARQATDAAVLHVSPPYRTVLGVWGMNLSKAIRDRNGEFLGVVTATLDHEYFKTLLGSVNYTDDSWSALAHGDGILFQMVPERAGQVGKNLAQPGSFFARHRDSGMAATVLTGIVYSTGEERMMAQRTIRLAAPAMDKPLVVAVGRDLRAIYAEWRREAYAKGGMLAAAALAAAIALALFQRRQRLQTSQLEHADALVRQHTRDLHSILDNLPSMIGYWDNTLHNRFANQAYHTWFGIDTGKMPGMHIREVIGEERYRLNLPYIEAVLRGEPQTFERAIPTPDGKDVRHSLANYVPDIVDGQVLGFYVLVSDISAAKKAEAALRASEREFRALVEASAQIVWSCNAEGAAVADSPSWRAYTGQTPEQWLGYGYIDCIHPDDRPAVLVRWQEGLRRGESTTNEYRLRRADGEWRWHLARGVPIRNDDGSIASWVGMNIDIHEQKCAALAMQAAKEAAEAASLAKSQFLATMSHEIRTPMNGILGMAQLLLQPTLTEDERRDYARTVLNSGQTLLTLLNDILDLSKVEAGKLELMRAMFDPAQLIDETAALFAEPAHAKGLAIEAAWNGPRGAYWADPIRVRQMLSNLLSNAIKFSEHGRIRVSAVEIERDAAHATLEFSVGDEGIGIAADKQSLLFKPFSQVDGSTTRRFGGTGLGLSIVRSLAEAMEGKVGVDSETGRGSRFWFRIRAALAHEGQDGRSAARSAIRAVAAHGNGGRILVAEDDPVNRRVIEAMLSKSGFDVRCVGNGQAVLDALSEGETPAVILMDCQMPVMDGLEATRRLRRLEADSGRARLPIVALTARAFAEDREQCLAAGMDEFIAKPVKLDELIQVLHRWIGNTAPPA